MRFEVGEVCYALSMYQPQYSGKLVECTITAGLEDRYIWRIAVCVPCYLVEVDGHTYGCRPSQLIKKPPPADSLDIKTPESLATT